MSEDGRLTGLVLVLPLDLEDIEKVGGSSMDFDDIFIWLGRGIWKIRDLEFVRSLKIYQQLQDQMEQKGLGYLDILSQLDAFHGHARVQGQGQTAGR